MYYTIMYYIRGRGVILDEKIVLQGRDYGIRKWNMVIWS